MVSFCVFLIIIIINFSFSDTHETDEIIRKFIVDMTTHFYASSTFTTFLCSSADRQFELSKFMSKNNKLHQMVTLSTAYELEYTWSESADQHFYVLDLNCPGSQSLLIQANVNRLFVAPTKWLILQDLRIDENSTSISEIFCDFDVFPDSEVIIGQRSSDAIALLSVYRPNAVISVIVEDLGVWTNENGIELRSTQVSSRRRINLQQTLLRAPLVVTESDTHDHLEDFQNRRVDTISKAGYLFTKFLIARMNASITFTFTPSWGYRYANGTWDGMIAEIHYHNADFGATAAFIISSRLDVVDFIQVYTPTRARFIFRQPPLSYVSNLFILPFAENVWIMGTIFCCLGFIILYVSLAWEWKGIEGLSYEEKLTGDLQGKPTFSDNFLIVIGAITQQGSAYEPRTVSARIVVFMLLLLCLSLFAAYTAKIVALLQSSSDSIKTLTDLMNGPLEVGIHDNLYNHFYFETFEDPERREFYERRVKSKDNMWLNVEDGVGRLRNELFAFHVDLTVGYDVVLKTFGEDEKCGLQEIDIFSLADPAFAIKPQSPYREILRVGARQIEENGLKHRLIARLYNKKPPCHNLKKFVSVGIIDCYAAYLTMGYGMGITLIILLIEIVVSKRFDNFGPEAMELDEGGTLPGEDALQVSSISDDPIGFNDV